MMRQLLVLMRRPETSTSPATLFTDSAALAAATDDADLDVHARRQAQAFVQRLDRFLGRAEDIYQALVCPDLELLAALAIDVRRSQDGVALDPGRQRDRTVDLRERILRGLDDLRCGAIEHLVIVAFHSDTDAFAGRTGHSLGSFCVTRIHRPRRLGKDQK